MKQNNISYIAAKRERKSGISVHLVSKRHIVEKDVGCRKSVDRWLEWMISERPFTFRQIAVFVPVGSCMRRSASCGRELTVGRARGLTRVHRQRQQRRCLSLRTRRLRPVLSLLCDPCVTVWTDVDSGALFAILISHLQWFIVLVPALRLCYKLSSGHTAYLETFKCGHSAWRLWGLSRVFVTILRRHTSCISWRANTRKMS